MKPEQRQLLALLRAGLWDTPVDATLFGEETDLTGLFELAGRHTVKGIVAEAVNKLPVCCQPPQPMMRSLAFFLSRSRMYYAGHQTVLAEILSKFAQHGIYPVLLKGLGMAVNYPDPALRYCGDIDLYTGPENFEKSVLPARQWKEANSSGMLTAKHYSFDYKGINVELHKVAEFLYLPRRNRYLQQWTKKHLRRESLRTLALNDKTPILLPPCRFDAVFILEHAWHHFVFLQGTGLRQICDWVMYLHRFHSELDTAELETDLKKLGLWRGWRLFGYIAVNYLGLPASELPFYDESVKPEAMEVLRQILAESYGDVAGRQTAPGYIGRKVTALRRQIGRWKVIRRHEGVFNVTVYSVCFLADGFYRMFKDWGKES